APRSTSFPPCWATMGTPPCSSLTAYAAVLDRSRRARKSLISGPPAPPPDACRWSLAGQQSAITPSGKEIGTRFHRFTRILNSSSARTTYVCYRILPILHHGTARTKYWGGASFSPPGRRPPRGSLSSRCACVLPSRRHALRRDRPDHRHSGVA